MHFNWKVQSSISRYVAVDAMSYLNQRQNAKSVRHCSTSLTRFCVTQWERSIMRDMSCPDDHVQRFAFGNDQNVFLCNITTTQQMNTFVRFIDSGPEAVWGKPQEYTHWIPPPPLRDSELPINHSQYKSISFGRWIVLRYAVCPTQNRNIHVIFYIYCSIYIWSTLCALPDSNYDTDVSIKWCAIILATARNSNRQPHLDANRGWRMVVYDYIGLPEVRNIEDNIYFVCLIITCYSVDIIEYRHFYFSIDYLMFYFCICVFEYAESYIPGV